MFLSRDFLETYHNKKFIVLNAQNNKYIQGLNFEEDGINFIDSDYLSDNLYDDTKPYMFYHEVSIPDDALICRVNENKFNSDKLILSEARKISEHELWSDEIFCLKVVSKYKGSLRYVRTQTWMVCYLAVALDGDSLKYVRDQDYDICLEAVKNNGMALSYVTIDQTDKICYEAVKNNPGALYYVKNQTPELCLMAVEKSGWLLKVVKNQSEEICLVAINNLVNAYYDVQVKTGVIIREAVKKSGTIIMSIDFPSSELILLAVKTFPYFLGFTKFTKQITDLPNLYPEMVKINGLCLEYIENPTHQLCLDAVAQNGFALYYVKDKSKYDKLYNVGFRQISKKYEELYKLIEILRNPRKRDHYYLEKNYTKEQLVKFRKQYNKLYEMIYFRLDGYDEIKDILKEYDMGYNDKRSFDLCMRFDELADNHNNLLISIILSDIDYVYEYMVGDFKILLTQPLNIKEVDFNLHDFLCELDQKPVVIKPYLETYENAEKYISLLI